MKILPADFRLSGVRTNCCEGAEGCRASGGASEERVAHAIQRRPGLLRESNADGVSTIVYNHGCAGRLAFQNGGGIDSNLFGREAGAGSHGRIDLKSGCGSADGVLDAVENVDDAVNIPNGVGYARRGIRKEFWILRKEFDHDGLRLAREVTDHVLQDLDELHFGGRFGLFDLRTDVGNDLIDVPLAVALELDGEIAAIGFRDRSEAKLQTGATRSIFDLGL